MTAAQAISYPLGYQASKTWKGHAFSMSVDAVCDTPLFTVRDLTIGKVFQGKSPTKPWTDVCMHLCPRKKTRVSGPLFFGFNDPHIAKLIRALPQEAAVSSSQMSIVLDCTPQRARLARDQSPEVAPAQDIGSTRCESPLALSPRIESRVPDSPRASPMLVSQQPPKPVVARLEEFVDDSSSGSDTEQELRRERHRLLQYLNKIQTTLALITSRKKSAATQPTPAKPTAEPMAVNPESVISPARADVQSSPEPHFVSPQLLESGSPAHSTLSHFNPPVQQPVESQPTLITTPQRPTNTITHVTPQSSTKRRRVGWDWDDSSGAIPPTLPMDVASVQTAPPKPASPPWVNVLRLHGLDSQASNSVMSDMCGTDVASSANATANVLPLESVFLPAPRLQLIAQLLHGSAVQMIKISSTTPMRIAVISKAAVIVWRADRDDQWVIERQLALKENESVASVAWVENTLALFGLFCSRSAQHTYPSLVLVKAEEARVFPMLGMPEQLPRMIYVGQTNTVVLVTDDGRFVSIRFSPQYEQIVEYLEATISGGVQHAVSIPNSSLVLCATSKELLVVDNVGAVQLGRCCITEDSRIESIVVSASGQRCNLVCSTDARTLVGEMTSHDSLEIRCSLKEVTACSSVAVGEAWVAGTSNGKLCIWNLQDGGVCAYLGCNSTTELNGSWVTVDCCSEFVCAGDGLGNVFLYRLYRPI
eukprot:TRINITY_DN4417_c0_g1_i1.p1 TRINITY_DN4417_c0_g1~~TRINITY_DN4417_c0_g1_i1.p1  ORF type:complete len:764 (+),score=128.67 TRINITY_DN4417_c0_g1_i1:176-2293(+)